MIRPDGKSCYNCYKFPNCATLRDFKADNCFDREEFIDEIGKVCSDFRKFDV